MKRIFLFLSILLCSLSMTAQSVWMFNRGDSISWQPSQDMTVTFEKDPAGFFWQNIQTGTLDIVRMPIYTNDGITFADTPCMQAEKNHFEVTNAEPRRFEVRLKTNITDWNSITCIPQAEWLKLVDVNGSQFPVIVYTFGYDANYTGDFRETQIAFSRDDLSDVVSVLSVGETATYSVSPKEITVTNSQDPRQFTVSLSSNVSEVLYGSTYQIVGNDGDWLRCVRDESNETGRIFTFDYDLNYTGANREAMVVFKNEQYNLSDTTKVISVGEKLVPCENVHFGYEDGTLIVVSPPNGGIIEIPIIGSTELKVKVNCIPNMRQLTDTIKNGIRYVRLEVDEVDEDISDCWISYYAENAIDWGNVFNFYQQNKNAPSLEELKEALIELYHATDGENWRENTNWLSDKPFNEWYGINNSRNNPGIKVIGNYIQFVDLRDNNLYGTIPESFATLMNLPELYLSVNYLYGKIPDSVIQHPKWQTLGWSIIMQDEICHGKALICDNYNLKVSDEEVELFVDETKSSIYDILKENELTLVFNYGTVAEIADLSDERVNLYLDYCNKGLGMVVQIDDWWEGNGYLSYNDYRSYVKNLQIEAGLPKGIKWIRSANIVFGKGDVTIFGSMCLLDKNGNVVGYWMKHGMDLRDCEYYYNQKIDSVLHARLGEPEDHEKYTTLYTSTDYSEDGRVIQLQEATVGSGIDIVFVGECFVDTDMGEYGLYEKTMRDAMEQFFSEEPYTSLRNRFNVYTVCAVSPNQTYQVDAKYAIGGSVEKAFEYAKKAVGERDDRLMVAVVCKPNAIPERSCTYMFEGDGSFVAFMFEGVSKVLNHEVGGHGIAFLLDEYVEQEKDSPTDDDKALLDAVYEAYGEGANVDWRSNPSEVKWSHFLNDSRYADEGLGVYEGAWSLGHGMYRPSENSTMCHNYASDIFNAPSREAIYKRVMELSEGDSWTYNYEDFVTFDAPARNAYKQTGAMNRVKSTDNQNIKKRRLESRPPTIYKGTWRDAGKCEKVEYISIEPRNQ